MPAARPCRLLGSVRHRLPFPCAGDCRLGGIRIRLRAGLPGSLRAGSRGKRDPPRCWSGDQDLARAPHFASKRHLSLEPSRDGDMLFVAILSFLFQTGTGFGGASVSVAYSPDSTLGLSAATSSGSAVADMFTLPAPVGRSNPLLNLLLSCLKSALSIYNHAHFSPSSYRSGRSRCTRTRRAPLRTLSPNYALASMRVRKTSTFRSSHSTAVIFSFSIVCLYILLLRWRMTGYRGSGFRRNPDVRRRAQLLPVSHRNLL